MSKDRDLLIALSEAVILLLDHAADHAAHRSSLERHNKIRAHLNQALQEAKQRKTGRA
jgi:NADH dehydrogenase FAD-containing subunit